MTSSKNAKEILKESSAITCVAIREEDIYISELKGINPIISKLIEDKTFFKGAILADKVIGKAAAMLLIYGQAKEIYAEIIGEEALYYLRKYKIPVDYEELVPFIENRNKDGMCPMEKLILKINEPEEAFRLISDKLSKNE